MPALRKQAAESKPKKGNLGCSVRNLGKGKDLAQAGIPLLTGFSGSTPTASASIAQVYMIPHLHLGRSQQFSIMYFSASRETPDDLTKAVAK